MLKLCSKWILQKKTLIRILSPKRMKVRVRKLGLMTHLNLNSSLNSKHIKYRSTVIRTNLRHSPFLLEKLAVKSNFEILIVPDLFELILEISDSIIHANLNFDAPRVHETDCPDLNLRISFSDQNLSDSFVRNLDQEFFLILVICGNYRLIP